MPLLAEYAITPDVLDVTSYSNANECEARLDYIKETILNAGLVRDLHDGLWSALFGPRGHQMHDTTRPAGTPAPASDAGARTWHRRGTELVRKLTSQNRLVRVPPRAARIRQLTTRSGAPRLSPRMPCSPSPAE